MDASQVFKTVIEEYKAEESTSGTIQSLLQRFQQLPTPMNRLIGGYCLPQTKIVSYTNQLVHMVVTVNVNDKLFGSIDVRFDGRAINIETVDDYLFADLFEMALNHPSDVRRACEARMATRYGTRVWKCPYCEMWLPTYPQLAEHETLEHAEAVIERLLGDLSL